MGLFGKKPPPAPALRRAKVMHLTKLILQQTDAGDRLYDDNAPQAAHDKFERAKNAVDAAANGCTQAEITAAYDAAGRHGYFG